MRIFLLIIALIPAVFNLVAPFIKRIHNQWIIVISTTISLLAIASTIYLAL
jgi:uncharacterized Tic20 family protein